MNPEENEPLTRLEIGWDDENDQPYLAAVGPVDTVGWIDEDRTYVADIPATDYKALEAAWKHAETLRTQILDAVAAKHDLTDEYRPQVCDQYQGDTEPARTSWHVAVRPSGNPDVWPAGNSSANLGWYPTEEEARAWIDALPERIWYHLGQGMPPQELDHDMLVVDHHTTAPWPSDCYTCGHSPASHGMSPETS